MNDLIQQKEYKKIFIVQHRHLANVVKSGTAPVLSSPALLGFIEETCLFENHQTKLALKSDLKVLY